MSKYTSNRRYRVTMPNKVIVYCNEFSVAVLAIAHFTRNPDQCHISITNLSLLYVLGKGEFAVGNTSIEIVDKEAVDFLETL